MTPTRTGGTRLGQVHPIIRITSTFVNNRTVPGRASKPIQETGIAVRQDDRAAINRYLSKKGYGVDSHWRLRKIWRGRLTTKEIHHLTKHNVPKEVIAELSLKRRLTEEAMHIAMSALRRSQRADPSIFFHLTMKDFSRAQALFKRWAVSY